MDKKVADKKANTAIKSPSQPQAREVPIVKEFEPVKKETRVTINLPLVFIGLAIIVSGVFSGYVLAGSNSSDSSSNSGGSGGIGGIGGLAKTAGKCTETSCKDTAEGTLREGGAESGEGTHHLERPGGVSQNVYLTSSTVSLASYVGKEVTVWGETFAAESAGWFMDVSKLEMK